MHTGTFVELKRLESEPNPAVKGHQIGHRAMGDGFEYPRGAGNEELGLAPYRAPKPIFRTPGG